LWILQNGLRIIFKRGCELKWKLTCDNVNLNLFHNLWTLNSWFSWLHCQVSVSRRVQTHLKVLAKFFFENVMNMSCTRFWLWLTLKMCRDLKKDGPGDGHYCTSESRSVVWVALYSCVAKGILITLDILWDHTRVILQLMLAFSL
jgi:hypothetical protein